jgi:DNA polymerase-3 subunit alpha
VEDAVVLVKARVSVRDDRISLIANDLAVPDLSAVGVAKPLAVTVTTRMCTPDKIGELKRVLSRHPGTSDVHIRHVGARDKTTLLKLDERLRVSPSTALMGDHKALLGPGCLAG